MSAGKIIAYIFASIVIFFGILFIWATFSPDGQITWLIVGIISVGIGFVIIWFTSRKKTVSQGEGGASIQIDLPGGVNLDTLKCKSCGGSLSMNNIEMVAGAPIVKCPYCNTSYQLTEDPKW